jgi:Lon protease-like protein
MAPSLERGMARVPLLALADYTLFPGTLVPFHVHAPGLVSAVTHALTADRRIAVLTPPRGGGPARVVGSIGRIVSDRRYDDGRIDIFVHGLERIEVLCGPGPDPRFSLSLDVVPDTHHPGAQLASERLRALARAHVRSLLQTGEAEEAEAVTAVMASTRDPGLLANRLAGALLTRPADRQRLLETQCPVRRCDLLVDAIGVRLMQMASVGRTVH